MYRDNVTIYRSFYKVLVRYNNLFETNLLHVSINYQIYALIYIAQTILLCVINILAVKLMHNTHKQLNFQMVTFI